MDYFYSAAALRLRGALWPSFALALIAVYRRIVVGTTQRLVNEDEAREVVEGIVFEINSDDPLLRACVLTMSQLIEHYRRRELSVDNTWKSYATQMGYENYLKRWIAPRWGT